MSDYIQLIKSLDSYLSDERYKTLITELLDTLLKELVNNIKSNMVFKELGYLEDNQRELYKVINKLNFDDSEIKKVYCLAYMKAILDIKSYSDKESLKEENATRLLKSHKRLSDLIENLYNENSLTHQELADRMDISKSNLSNLINKPEITKLVTKSRYKKRVYYSVSSDGHKLYKQIAVNKSKLINSEQYTELFIRMIDSIQTEISSEYVNVSRFWNGISCNSGDNILFTKSNTIRNKLNKLIDTMNRQKPYNWYNISVKVKQDVANCSKPAVKLLPVNSKALKGDIYEYYK